MAKFATINVEGESAKATAGQLQRLRDEVASRTLEGEVRRNGYGYCLKIKEPMQSITTLRQIAEEKLQHPRHRELGSPLNLEEMLAVLLYTGTDCYADLRCSERDGDYRKWCRFASVLDIAVYNLAVVAAANCIELPPTLYHGLGHVYAQDLPEVCLGGAHDTVYCALGFSSPTFMSTSWDRKVATDFILMNGSTEHSVNGLLLQMAGRKAAQIGADVSWISKFPEECEVLLGRFAYFSSDTWDWGSGESSEGILAETLHIEGQLQTLRIDVQGSVLLHYQHKDGGGYADYSQTSLLPSFITPQMSEKHLIGDPPDPAKVARKQWKAMHEASQAHLLPEVTQLLEEMSEHDRAWDHKWYRLPLCSLIYPIDLQQVRTLAERQGCPFRLMHLESPELRSSDHVWLTC